MDKASAYAIIAISIFSPAILIFGGMSWLAESIPVPRDNIFNPVTATIGLLTLGIPFIIACGFLYPELTRKKSEPHPFRNNPTFTKLVSATESRHSNQVDPAGFLMGAIIANFVAIMYVYFG